MFPQNATSYLIQVCATITAVSSLSYPSASLSAQPSELWGRTEIYGVTLTERQAVSQETLAIEGSPFPTDPDKLQAICSRIRRNLANRHVECSLVIDNNATPHYLVEVYVPSRTEKYKTQRFNSSSKLPQKLVKRLERFNAAYMDHVAQLRPEALKVTNGVPIFGVDELDSLSYDLRLAAAPHAKIINLVLNTAKSNEQRATAALLIAWSIDPEHSIRTGISAFSDPDPSVRNGFSYAAAIHAPYLPTELRQDLITQWCHLAATPNYLDRSKALLGLSRVALNECAHIPKTCQSTARNIGVETVIPAMQDMVNQILICRTVNNVDPDH